MAAKNETNETAQQVNEIEALQDKIDGLLGGVIETQYNPQEFTDKTRADIAKYFVKGYFALSVFIFVFSFIYNLILMSVGRETHTLDVIQTFTAVSGALSGLLGFVLGYYFKGNEE